LAIGGRYYSTGSGSQATCGYDPGRKLFVVAGGPKPTSQFVYWNLATPGSDNRETAFMPQDPTGEFNQLVATDSTLLRKCGMKFDPRRGDYKLWCGDGRVWSLKAPAALSASGWTIEKAAVPTTAVPGETVGTGILGKWKYIPNLDVFLGLADPVLGNIWIYKPAGWVNPRGGNLPPQVSLLRPATGASSVQGDAIAIDADARDPDGQIVKVEYYANGAKLGESTTAPHGMVWTTATAGNWTLAAVATDDSGAQSNSASVAITVLPNTPTNQPPNVGLTQPAEGAFYAAGVAIAVAASASDGDGAVARVEFYAAAAKIGEVTQAPYVITWDGAPVGTHSITAVAIDDDGASTISGARNITVAGGGTGGTVTLQRGAGGTTADTYLSSYHKTLNFGALNNLQDQFQYYTPLLRFAIFQSEGGPVPNGATITSAKLSIYKYSSYNMNYGLHRVLQDWQEAGASWNLRSAAAAWAVAGANGAGTDFAATADTTAATDFNPGWIVFDVTQAVAAMSASTPTANFGWRLRGASGYTSGMKKFYTSEFDADPSLRPKLVVSYQ
jgi:hypothetical protein